MLSASCCIVPLGFVLLGVSGAWVGNLTMLAPYKWLFVAVATVFLGLGFRQAYLRERLPCENGAYCARPQSSRLVRTALWLGTALVALSATVEWWAPRFY